MESFCKICFLELRDSRLKLWMLPYTVCPGSSDPPEKILNIFASENEVYTIFNYYDILG